MKCYKCGRKWGSFKEVIFQTIDGVVKERRDYCSTCFNKKFPKFVHKVIELWREDK